MISGWLSALTELFACVMAKYWMQEKASPLPQRLRPGTFVGTKSVTIIMQSELTEHQIGGGRLDAGQVDE
jgi:hypothetical protein